MRHAALGWETLVVGVALLLPAPAVAQKKKPKEGVGVATKQEYDALIKAKEMTGKLVDIDDAVKTVTVRVEYKSYEPKPNAAAKLSAAQQKHMQHWQNRYNEIMRYKNPVHRAQALSEFYTHVQQQMAKDSDLSKLVNIKTERKDFDLDTIEKISVRWKELPVEYDDKGVAKEPTAKELKERKGKDPKVPGYSAEWTDLKVGQEVQIFVTGPKKKAKPAKEPAKDKKDEPVKDKKDESAKDKKDEPAKDKKDDEAKLENKVGEKGSLDTPGEPRLAAVRMIVIVSESDLPATNPKKGKKKN